jgi:2-polyprenyl-6-methoxyphenol hydroxylase-like FAD-dependent oxidoreductase
MIDVLMIGGGPAGSAAALRLAQLGHAVRLVERSSFPRPHVGESLSPGVWVHFATLGVLERIERAGFRLAFETLLRWRGETERIVTERPSLIVDRARFDALLLDAARAAGVDVRQPAEISDADVRNARFVIDASGRAGVTRRPRRPTAPRLLAWHARWPAAARRETLVERLGDAWLWGTALPDGTFSAMKFGGDAAPMRDALQRSELFAWLGDPIERPRAVDATPYVCDAPIDARGAAVGEAAFAIDPISSSGVQTALASSIAAAIAINTILRRPEDAAAAIAFYTAHVARASARHTAWAAESYAPQPLSDAPPIAIDDAALLAANHDAAVTVPLARGDFVELAPAIRTASGDAVAFLGETPLAPLVASLTSPAPAHRIVERWSATMPRRRAAEVLAWLVEQRAVVAAAPSPTPVSNP